MRSILNVLVATLLSFATAAFAIPNGRPTDAEVKKLAAERGIKNAAEAAISCTHVAIDTTKRTTTMTNDQGQTKVLPKVIAAGAQYVYVCQVGKVNPLDPIVVVKHRQGGKLALLVRGVEK